MSNAKAVGNGGAKGKSAGQASKGPGGKPSTKPGKKSGGGRDNAVPRSERTSDAKNLNE